MKHTGNITLEYLSISDEDMPNILFKSSARLQADCLSHSLIFTELWWVLLENAPCDASLYVTS